MADLTNVYGDGIELSDEQKNICKEINKKSNNKKKPSWYLISGYAGTGKTICLYQEAKEILEKEKKINPKNTHCVLIVAGTQHSIHEFFEPLIENNFEEYEGMYRYCHKTEYLEKFYRDNSGNDSAVSIYAVQKLNKEKLEKIYEEDNHKDRTEYDYILIDEAQDFSLPELYIFARKAKKKFIIVGSKEQDVFYQNWTNSSEYCDKSRGSFGNTVPQHKWEAAKDKLEHVLDNSFTSMELKKIQYRSTKQIADFLNQIMVKEIENGEVKKISIESNIQGTDLPIIYVCKDSGRELDIFVKEICKQAQVIMTQEKEGTKECTRTIGVLSMYNQDTYGIQKIESRIKDQKDYKENQEKYDSIIKLYNIANAKGLEFHTVFLMAESFGHNRWSIEIERRNLYTAASRATNALFIFMAKDNENHFSQYFKPNTYKMTEIG